MSDFYKPYPEEFYALNELLDNQPHLAINTIDCVNRCINYNTIDPDKKRFLPDIFNNVLSYLVKNQFRIQRYIEFVFPAQEQARQKAILKRFIQKDPGRVSYQDQVELHP